MFSWAGRLSGSSGLGRVWGGRREGGRAQHPESRAVQSRPARPPPPGIPQLAQALVLGTAPLEGAERSPAWEGFHPPQSWLWGAGLKGGREVWGGCLMVLESCNLF